jgi:pyruvate ferredoxin oxidoreductase beta subunit
MAATTTSPAGREIKGQRTGKKNVCEIMVAQGVSYVATACPSYPIDLVNKVKKAKAVKGPSYLHVFSMCPTGWRCASELTIKIGRLAVETGVFPLYEVENGKYRITVEMPERRRPVEDYLKHQGRFSHLNAEDIKLVQQKVDYEMKKLMDKVSGLKGWDEI